MTLGELLRNDKEIIELRDAIRKEGGISYGFNFDEYKDVDDYKNELRKQLAEIKKSKDIICNMKRK